MLHISLHLERKRVSTSLIEISFERMCDGYATLSRIKIILPNRNSSRICSPPFTFVINVDKRVCTLCIPRRITDFGALPATSVINFSRRLIKIRVSVQSSTCLNHKKDCFFARAR